jgi:hypothetical protein
MQARNEVGHIETTLATLIAEGIEVVLLANGSIDGTAEVAERFLGGGLLRIEHVPWRGVFDRAPTRGTRAPSIGRPRRRSTPGIRSSSGPDG